MKKLSWHGSMTLALVLLVPLTAACGKTVGEAIDDTTITTRVKTAMLNDPGVGGLRIDVDTFKGVVTLSGRVKSQAEHDQAIALARRVNGVTEVKDALQIITEGQPAPEAPKTEAPKTEGARPEGVKPEGPK